MKIQTNTGEVELTANMVRPGMVLRTRSGRTLALERPERIAAIGVWLTTDNLVAEVPLAVVAGTLVFLGCDPAIAAREDVERYGVAPGVDAAEHGFARLPTGGALDLAKPENVRKGMLFRVQVNPEVYGTATRDIVAARDGNFGVPPGAGRFLGCHPEIARREDCERFGIPERVEQNGVQDGPINAGAHGFARLRGGGAVDLQKTVVNGAVIVAGADSWGDIKAGKRFTNFNAWLRPGDRFIGLDARHARAEDVKRLCCGAEHAYRVGERAMGRDVCTLAIGDHDTHEDIAAGTRWPAKVASPDASGWTLSAADAGIVSVARLRAQLGIRDPACPGCGAANGARCPDACPDMRRRREEWEASHCGAHAKPGQRLTSERGEHRPAHGDERCTNGKDCNGQHDMAFRGPWGTRWTDDAPLVGCSRCDAPVIPTAERPPMGLTAQDEAGAYRQGWLCEACAAAREDLVWRGGRLVAVAKEKPEAWHTVPKLATSEGAEQPIRCPQCRALASPGQGAWCSAKCRDEHARESADAQRALAAIGKDAKRRAADAPLVALVAAVPPGLDPIGWRAAVLAVHEVSGDVATPDAWADAECEKALRIMVAIGVAADAYSDVEQVALDAYRRAVAPQVPRPAPERKRGGRAVRLTVDDGSDD